MKAILVLCILFLLVSVTQGAGIKKVFPDLPSIDPVTQPRVANPISFPVGSLIIDMGKFQIEDTDVTGDFVPVDPVTSNTRDYCNTATGLVNYPNGVDTFCSPSMSGGAKPPCTRIRASKSGLFNAYAYGFAVRLVHNAIPVYWAIKSNKAQNDVDFTSQSIRIRPTRDPAGSINWGSRTAVAANDHISGPLLVHASDAAQALTLLNRITSAGGKFTGKGRFESVVIFNLTTAQTIDIRHKIITKPYIIASAVEGKWCDYSAHPLILWNSGLEEGPFNGFNDSTTGHFKLLTNASSLGEFNESTCASSFSEPHVIFDPSNNCAVDRCVDVPKYKVPLQKFIVSGGNFFTQCAGVPSYENVNWDTQYYPPTNRSRKGNFISAYGIYGIGNSGNEWTGKNTANANWYYNYPDLPIVQFNGKVAANIGGTITSFYLMEKDATTTTGPSLQNELFADNAYGLMRTSLTTANWNANIDKPSSGGGCKKCCPGSPGSACTSPNTVPASKTPWFAAGVNILDTTNTTKKVGGNVWMMGGHSWFSTLSGYDATTPSKFAENADQVNGKRIYLNSILVPASRPPACAFGVCIDECPGLNNIGTCQVCNCTAAKKENVINVPSMCDVAPYGSCYMCSTGGNCVPKVTCVAPLVFTPSVAGTCCACPATTVCVAPNTLNPVTCACNPPSPSNTVTPTRTPSVTPSATSSVTPSRTPSSSATPSATSSVTPSTTSSVTPSRTSSVTPSATSSVTPSASRSTTPSVTPSETPSNSPFSGSPSNTPSISFSSSVTATRTPSSSATSSVTPSTTSSVTPSRTSSVTPSATSSVTPSVTPSTTSSVTPSSSRTPSNSPFSGSPSNTPSTSFSSSVTATRTPSVTPTSSVTPSRTPSVSRSNSPVAPSNSSTPSPTRSYAPPAIIEDSGSDNTARTAGIAVGASVAGILGIAGAAAAAAALFWYKKKHPAPKIDSAVGDNLASGNTNINPMYEAHSATMDNPLYCHK